MRVALVILTAALLLESVPAAAGFRDCWQALARTAAITWPFRSGSKYTSIRMGKARVGPRGGWQLELWRRRGRAWDPIAERPSLIYPANNPQGDPRLFIRYFGPSVAQFFGFEQVSDNLILVPDAIEFNRAVESFNEAARRLGARLWRTRLENVAGLFEDRPYLDLMVETESFPFAMIDELETGHDRVFHVFNYWYHGQLLDLFLRQGAELFALEKFAHERKYKKLLRSRYFQALIDAEIHFIGHQIDTTSGNLHALVRHIIFGGELPASTRKHLEDMIRHPLSAAEYLQAMTRRGDKDEPYARTIEGFPFPTRFVRRFRALTGDFAAFRAGDPLFHRRLEITVDDLITDARARLRDFRRVMAELLKEPR